jgi:hypothetical protein
MDLYIHFPIRFHRVVLNYLSSGTHNLHGVITQKIDAFILTAVRTLNPTHLEICCCEYALLRATVFHNVTNTTKPMN